MNKHAEFIRQYADDSINYDIPWELWEYRQTTFGQNSSQWHDCPQPLFWASNFEYRRKPGKKKTIMVNGVELPEPERNPLIENQEFFSADFLVILNYQWRNSDLNKKWLKEGLIHLTREDAQAWIDFFLSCSAPKQ